MNLMYKAVERISGYAIRLFPFLVAACVLLFPAYKNMWPGYVPVITGVAFIAMCHRKKAELSLEVECWSNRTMNLWLFVLPAAVQIVLIAVIQSDPTFDGLAVVAHAEHLMLTGRMDPLTYYPPLQTWWYAGWFWLFGVSTPVAQLSHIPLSLGITWSVYRLAQSLGNKVPARMAALAVAWYPSFLGYVLTTPYYHYLYTLLTLWMVGGLLFATRSGIQKPSMAIPPWICWVGAGMAAGLGALTKGTQLIAPLQVVTWLVVFSCVTKSLSWRKMAGGLVVFGAGMLVVIGPWMVRNYQVFGDIVPVCTSGGLVLYSANNPESNGLYSNIPDVVQLSTPAEMLIHSRWCSEQAKEFMRQHPRDFIHLAVKKFFHTWGVEATFTDLINRNGKPCIKTEQGFSFIFLAGWSALMAAWIFRVMQQLRGRLDLTEYEILAGVLILSNALVYVVFEGGDRHHLPLVPLIILCLIPRGSTGRTLDA